MATQLAELAEALERFQPPFAEALRNATPVFNALAEASDEPVSASVDAFVIGSFKLINVVQATLASYDDSPGLAADLIDLAAERLCRRGGLGRSDDSIVERIVGYTEQWPVDLGNQ